MAIPETQTAIVCVPGKPGLNLAITQESPLPLPLAQDEVLVQTLAVALNPCDWKMPDNFPTVGAVDGSDFSGTIVAIGSGVSTTHPHLAVGDRVCGAVHGTSPTTPRNGSFSQYVAANADILMKLPVSVSWEDAAAIGGTSIATLGVVFDEYLKLGFNPRNPANETQAFPVLVYGGGTATGSMAIQLLKASGLRPIAVCSPKSAPLALSHGAEKTFDYNSATCAAQIKDYLGRKLRHILDIITVETSMKLCYDAMGRLGGTYVGLELIPSAGPAKSLIKADWVLGQTVFGKEIPLSGGYGRPSLASHRATGKLWFSMAEEMMHKGALKPHPVTIGKDYGFEAILEGIDLMRRRLVAREKLVYFIQRLDIS